jgi:uncharacterized membrane protein YozB (DUF420 family)
MDLGQLPVVNAMLNTIATLLLLSAYAAIRRKNVRLHRWLMLSAFCVSVAFLTLYLVHKWYLWSLTGSYNTYFSGVGWWRTLYFVVLITHVLLAVVLPVLASITLFRGLNMKIDKHRFIAKITLPVWLYVSVTGVVVYFMLYQWFAPAGFAQ